MRLLFKGNALYKNGMIYCRAEAGNGRIEVPVGIYKVEVLTATEHGSVPMPYAHGLGWVGGLVGCDLVVGRITGRHGLLPSLDTQNHLVALCELVADAGEYVTLEVRA